jgi:hypothetical protein
LEAGASAVDHARQQVTADLVGAEAIGLRGGLAQGREIGAGGVERCDPGRGDGDEDEDQHDHQTEHRHGPADHPPQSALPDPTRPQAERVETGGRDASGRHPRPMKVILGLSQA